MQEFLNLYSKIENPTFEMVVFSFLLAFLLAILVAKTYAATSPKTLKTPNFIQALILSATITSTVIQSTSSSLGTGLGMLGVLTIIQFRTTFRDPRDIIFMFAAISCGISCGSYVFLIAIVGALGFCFIALSLRFTPYYSGSHLIWELRLKLKTSPENIAFTKQTLDEFCRRWTVESSKNEKDKNEVPYKEIDYVIILKDDEAFEAFEERLEANNILVKKINKQNNDFSANNT
jgi:hypothetical protein